MIGQSLQFQSRCFSIFKVVERTSGDFSKNERPSKFLCCHKKKSNPRSIKKNFQTPFSLPSWHMMWIFWISQSGHFFRWHSKEFKSKKKHFNLIMVIFKKLIFTTYQNSAIPAIWSYVSSAAFLFEFICQAAILIIKVWYSIMCYYCVL